MKHFLPIFLFLICSIPLFAENESKMRIAVMDLKCEQVDPATGRTVSNMLRNELINKKEFTVVERSQMDSILQEQGFQQTSCTDQDCAIQIGKIVSAQKIMVGELSKLGKSYIITVRILDVETGTSDFAAKEKSLSDEKLDKSCRALAETLSDQIRRNLHKQKKIESAKINVKTESLVVKKQYPVNRFGYYSLGFIPGASQIYSGHNVKGSLLLTSNILSIGFCLYSVTSASNLNIISFGLFAAIYIWNWIDLLFINDVKFSDNNAYLPKPCKRYFYSISLGSDLFSHKATPDVAIAMGVRF